jgi:uncharacterized repeat protein (TIGR01451 family)
MKTARGFAVGFPWNFRSVDGVVREAAAPRNVGWCAIIGLISLTVIFSGCGLNGLSLLASIPVITGSTPNAIPAGASAQQITISGTGFNSAVVTANGTPLVVISLTSTQIVAVIPGSLLTQPGTITIVVVDLLPSGNVTSNGATITVTGSSTSKPDLTITKTHTGNFTQGQSGATYTITVSNVGNGASSGMVSVTDTLPASLTLTALSGPGWACVIATVTCDRSDALAGGASYPAITLTVNVSTSAPSSVTNTAAVSGGGDTNANNNSASDQTTVASSAGSPSLDMGVLASPNTFPKGGTASYDASMSNAGTASTSGTVTFVATLDPSLTQTAISGSGWACVLATLTCTRSDALTPGNLYPDITITVSVSPGAPASVTSTFKVSGGGSAPFMRTVTNATM